MAQRSISFLVVLLLIFYGEINGQKNDCIPQKKDSLISQTRGFGGCNGWNTNGLVFTRSTEEIKLLLKLPIDYNKLENFNFEKQLKLDYTSKDTAGIRKTVSPLYLFKTIPLPFSTDCWGSFTSYDARLWNYQASQGWFCKKELQLDKVTAIPFRFRLGSLNYVNWMEKKPNATKSY